MKCPKCRFQNPKDSIYYGNCGECLDSEIVCGNCGALLPAAFKFCNKCGTATTPSKETSVNILSFDEKISRIQRYLPKGLVDKILSKREKIEGERKLVTILFCDMQGYTLISERLGPEKAYTLMDQVYEILIHKIHDYEGTVNEFTGDGVMALFGAPVALEDHAIRACHAALQVRRRMKEYTGEMESRYGIQFQTRTGVHTGPVVVGAIGDNLRLDYTAVGDTTNLAARLQAQAPPGEIFVEKKRKSLYRSHSLLLLNHRTCSA